MIVAVWAITSSPAILLLLLALVGLLRIIRAAHGLDAALSGMPVCNTVSNTGQATGCCLAKVVRTWSDVTLGPSAVA